MRTSLKYTLVLILFLVLSWLVSQELRLQVASAQTTVNDSTLIYYRIDDNDNNPATHLDQCGGSLPISLGDFIKKTLPFEWIDSWGNAPNGEEALKAGAIAIRSWVLSDANSEIHPVGGQEYFCVDARFDRIQFHHDAIVNQTTYPNVIDAVGDTNGIIMTHSDASTILGINAIDAQFRTEAGGFTSTYPSRSWDNKPWLVGIYDPISVDYTSSDNPWGMGVYGSIRWATGETNPFLEAGESSTNFPRWNYLQILAHYYTGVDFVGVTPDPPDDRFNVLQVYGLDPQQGISLERGEVKSGYTVLVQNTGQETWDVTALDACNLQNSTEYDFQTLLAHHVYQQGGSPACTNCIGLMWEPFCRDDTYSYNPVDPGEHFWLYGYKFFMPNQDSITQGTTYNLRFDILRQVNAGQMQWTGYSDFKWPGQDIPVLVPTPLPPNLPEVRVDKPPAVVSSADLEDGKMTFSWSGVNAATFDLDYKVKDITEQTFPTGYSTVLSNSADQSYATVINCDTDRRDWEFRLRGWKNGQAGGWTEFGVKTQVYPFAWPTSSALTVTIPSDSNTVWSNPVGMTNMGGGYLFWSAGTNQTWLSVYGWVEGPGPGGTMPLGLTVTRPGGIGDYYGNVTVNLAYQDDFCGDTNFVIPVTVRVLEMPYKSYLPVIFQSGQ